MDKLHQSDYAVIFHDPEKRYITRRWTAYSTNMTDEDYREEQDTLYRYLSVYQPIAMLANLNDFNYTIPPDLQSWNASRVKEIGQVGLPERIAILASSNTFASISVELMVDDFNEQSENVTEYRYFQNQKEAEEWLSERLNMDL